MHRIDTSTAQPNLFGAGKSGFRDGNKATGIAATALDAKFFNTLQEEISSVIENFAALDPASHTQLRDVLLAHFARLDGATFTGSIIGNSPTCRQVGAYLWGDMSSGAGGSVLFGNNCYLSLLGNTYHYTTTHPNLGARGLVMVPGVGLRWFDTGAVATITDAEFTPTLVALPTTWASDAEAQALTAPDRLISPAGLKAAFKGAKQLLAANGHQQSPGGWIIQGGTAVVVADAITTIIFPTAFPTACIAVVAVPEYGSAVGGVNVLSAHVGNVTAANFGIGVSENGVSLVTSSRWIAVGY